WSRGGTDPLARTGRRRPPALAPRVGAEWQDRHMPTARGRAADRSRSAAAEQPLLPGMPARLVVATPSKLAAYEDCPRRYRYSHVDRPAPPKGPPWAPNSLGASLHTALRNWYEVPPARRSPELAATLLRAGWVREGYRDEEQERQVWRRAVG